MNSMEYKWQYLKESGEEWTRRELAGRKALVWAGFMSIGLQRPVSLMEALEDLIKQDREKEKRC